jgi:hypothetical protein
MSGVRTRNRALAVMLGAAIFLCMVLAHGVGHGHSASVSVAVRSESAVMSAMLAPAHVHSSDMSLAVHRSALGSERSPSHGGAGDGHGNHDGSGCRTTVCINDGKSRQLSTSFLWSALLVGALFVGSASRGASSQRGLLQHVLGLCPTGLSPLQISGVARR